MPRTKDGAEEGPRTSEVRPIKLTILLVVAIQLSGWLIALGQAPKMNEYGPEIKSFLDLMRHEEDELDFQIKHNEISRREYLRSKTRISIHRQTILDLAKESGLDDVPDLYVVTAPEIDQLIENGAAAVKGIKPRAIVAEKWRYLGNIRRGETFYIFERLTAR